MKKLNLSLLILLLSISMIGFTSCKDPEPAHEHDFSDSWSKDGTYHWHAATCEHTTEVSDKAAHSFGDWTTTKEATEEAEGSKERVCTVCGYTATEVIEKLAHTHKFATEWTSDATGHWHACNCGEKSEFATHTFEWEITQNPTETEKGEKTGTCTVCDYNETVEIAKIPEGFVFVKGDTVTGAAYTNKYKGVFIEGRTVTLSDFYMGKYEVTQEEYEKYCSYSGSKPSSSEGDGDNYPAYYVSWYDALVYCNKRSIDEGLTPCYSISGNIDPSKWGTVPTSSDSTWNEAVCNWNANGYRLPTEAEWEYAARAGDNTVSSKTYAGTNSSSKLGEYAWYYDNSGSKTHPVGTKKANAFGLYDMSGNVCELCWNRYTSSYDTGTEGGSDPTGASSGSSRVGRGGGWNLISDYCAVSDRISRSPYYPYNNVGLRLVRSAVAQ